MRISRRAAYLAIGLSGIAACGDSDDAPDESACGAACDPLDAGGADSEDTQEGSDQDAGDGLDSGDELQEVAIRFKAKIGDRDLACGQPYAMQGSTNIMATPQDFRFFVQEVRLVHKGSDKEERVQFDVRPPFQRAEVALIDFTDGTGKCAGRGGSVVNTTIYGKVPAGEYDGIVFVNGVPEELNHAGPAESAPAPLDDVTLFWNWLGGYRFIVAELLPMSQAHDAGAPDAAVGNGDAGADAGAHAADAAAPAGDAGSGHAGSAAAFVHVGSTGCSGSESAGFSCTRQARNEVRLSGFDPARNAVVADLGQVFKGSDLSAPLQCHSVAPICAAPYGALGIDMHTGTPASTQQVFRVE